MALLLALAACQPTPPPPAAKVPPAEPHIAVPPPPLRLGWSFNQAPDACHATARAGAVRLDVAVSGHDPIELKLSGLPALADHAGHRVAWMFSGSAGHWRLLSAVRASHDLVAYIAPGERSAGRVLALLSGGMLTIGEAPPGQRRLRLPASDAAGQTWFDCVRSQR
jgi:hypothetical protein